MAKSYYAVNTIRHGVGGEVKVFEPGDQVTGLSKDEMVALWEAGVLEERDPSKPAPDERDAEIERLKAQIEALEAEKKAAAEAKDEEPREVTEVPGMGGATPNTSQAAADMVGTVNDPPKDESSTSSEAGNVGVDDSDKEPDA